jgi:putative glutamine amidotransferase
MRPLIGIPCHADFRAGTGRPIYCNNRAYVHAVESAGGVPVLIPLLDDLSSLDTLLPRLDGLLLPGGVDVSLTITVKSPIHCLTMLIHSLTS